MSSPATRAEDLAEQLSEAGFTPRIEEHEARICVEVDVPASVSSASWAALLAVLEAADRFGLTSGTGGLTVWAAVHKRTPVADAPARGCGQQLEGAD